MLFSGQKQLQDFPGPVLTLLYYTLSIVTRPKKINTYRFVETRYRKRALLHSLVNQLVDTGFNGTYPQYRLIWLFASKLFIKNSLKSKTVAFNNKFNNKKRFIPASFTTYSKIVSFDPSGIFGKSRHFSVRMCSSILARSSSSRRAPALHINANTMSLFKWFVCRRPCSSRFGIKPASKSQACVEIIFEKKLEKLPILISIKKVKSVNI